MAFLDRIAADGSPAECWAVADTPLVVGQGESADAQVEDDTLSHSHFLIVREGPDFFLVDLESRNGTWVNDQRISAGKLHPDELIRAGKSLFQFTTSMHPAGAPQQPTADPAHPLPRAA